MTARHWAAWVLFFTLLTGLFADDTPNLWTAIPTAVIAAWAGIYATRPLINEGTN